MFENKWRGSLSSLNSFRNDIDGNSGFAVDSIKLPSVEKHKGTWSTKILSSFGIFSKGLNLTISVFFRFTSVEVSYAETFLI